MDYTESCQRFVQLWEGPNPTGYGSRKRWIPRRDWICLDEDNGPDSWCGVYMVRKADGLVFEIKGYGRPNLKKCCGHIDAMVLRLQNPITLNS